MNSLYVIIGAAVVAVFLAVWWIELHRFKKSLEMRKNAIDQEESRLLDENKALADEEKRFENYVREYKPFLEGEVVELSASYAVSDSDYMKYRSENAVKNVARNRIAHNIAYDIIRQFPEPKLEGGVYSYRLKVIDAN